VLVGLMFYGGFWTLKSVFGNAYTVSAYVPNARGLAPDAHVVIAGLEVGKVTSIQRHGPNAILGLRIDSAPTPLPVDSRVAVRLRSLAGESYVQIYPGTSRVKVTSGASLGLSHSVDYVDVDQILQAFSGNTQTHTRELIQGLGGALSGRGQQLNQLLGAASNLITDSLPLTSTLAAEHNQVGDLVQSFGTMMQTVGQRTADVRGFATGARLTFDAIAARDRALHDTLQQLPYLLTSLRQASNTVSTVSPPISPLATNLAAAINLLAPSIHVLSPAASRGRALLASLGGASLPLREVLQNLVTLQQPAAAALPQVDQALCQINPMLKYLAPYQASFGSFFQNFGSTGNAYDGTGHFGRANEVIAPADVGGIYGNQTAAAYQFLLKAVGLQKVNQLGFDPLPPPGGSHNTQLGLGVYGPAAASKVFHYPHVTAGYC
jgi:phospholipid/cholesterol/gamma-HCH transport system substrate-binding protein